MNKPPYSITSRILNLTGEIHEAIGELKNLAVSKPSIKLRKENKIKTIHHSLAIEGNTLTEKQITAILDNKRVLGPERQILEVKNALAAYDRLSELDPVKEKDLLKAHKLLMKGLVKKSGCYRSSQVGIFKGTKVSHVAPQAKQVPELMGKLFHFLKDREASWMIKACVFHYELEFIHPFEDGNGRMGRLWQQLLLMKYSKIFEYISTETITHKKQKAYYSVLEKCDRSGDSTLFIEFSLQGILESLNEFKTGHAISKPRASDRIKFALDHFKNSSFSRKDYLSLFPEISTATASRDLALATESGFLVKTGDRVKSVYRARE
jgi:Fic family protein